MKLLDPVKYKNRNKIKDQLNEQKVKVDKEKQNMSEVRLSLREQERFELTHPELKALFTDIKQKMVLAEEKYSKRKIANTLDQAHICLVSENPSYRYCAEEMVSALERLEAIPVTEIKSFFLKVMPFVTYNTEQAVKNYFTCMQDLLNLSCAQKLIFYISASSRLALNPQYKESCIEEIESRYFYNKEIIQMFTKFRTDNGTKVESGLLLNHLLSETLGEAISDLRIFFYDIEKENYEFREFATIDNNEREKREYKNDIKKQIYQNDEVISQVEIASKQIKNVKKEEIVKFFIERQAYNLWEEIKEESMCLPAGHWEEERLKWKEEVVMSIINCEINQSLFFTLYRYDVHNFPELQKGRSCIYSPMELMIAYSNKVKTVEINNFKQIGIFLY